MECYLLNTGSVGAGPDSAGEKITIAVSTQILKEIARGGITWQTDPDWDYQVPVHVPGLDLSRFTPAAYYPAAVYRELVEKLRAERQQWLAKYPGLKPEIVQAIEPPAGNCHKAS